MVTWAGPEEQPWQNHQRHDALTPPPPSHGPTISGHWQKKAGFPFNTKASYRGTGLGERAPRGTPEGSQVCVPTACSQFLRKQCKAPLPIPELPPASHPHTWEISGLITQQRCAQLQPSWGRSVSPSSQCWKGLGPAHINLALCTREWQTPPGPALTAYSGSQSFFCSQQEFCSRKDLVYRSYTLKSSGTKGLFTSANF